MSTNEHQGHSAILPSHHLLRNLDVSASQHPAPWHADPEDSPNTPGLDYSLHGGTRSCHLCGHDAISRSADRFAQARPPVHRILLPPATLAWMATLPCLLLQHEGVRGAQQAGPAPGAGAEDEASGRHRRARLAATDHEAGREHQGSIKGRPTGKNGSTGTGLVAGGTGWGAVCAPAASVTARDQYGGIRGLRAILVSTVAGETAGRHQRRDGRRSLCRPVPITAGLTCARRWLEGPAAQSQPTPGRLAARSDGLDLPGCGQPVRWPARPGVEL